MSMTMHSLNVGQIPQWNLSDRLRKARESSGLGQIELAEVSGISRATISAAENGHRKPSSATIRLWALATGVPYSWLLDGSTPPSGDRSTSGEVID